ncbi:heat shock protein Hsp15 [Breoghania corrubedonensis]|uniref:Heat shock protein Hsp15 n=1 Tax=Breoghania corrubedonensis TaxID=665038 RepID=A0A2T5V5M6_9HYPH|nr:RNA-binding S4 domain-containing protein [Breoghania corrubedonensis]PTW59058.1 heat shock protein Hsp15 [Breoghania corrubedonensis]
MPGVEEQGRLRIDKWLWHARVTKSRSLAQKLVASGHVRLNKERVRGAAQQVRADDVLTVALERRVLILRIRALGHRRGPAAEARLLYEDLSPPPAPREERPAPVALRDAGTGRPTKRERRQLERFFDDGSDES